jgi:hypothetical protein
MRPLTTDDLLIVAECTRLMNEYGHRLDTGRGASVSELFTEDGVYVTPAAECRGRGDLREFFAKRDNLRDRVTHHVMTNATIEVDSADRATGRAVAIEFRSDDGSAGAIRTDTRPAIVGNYEDVFVRTDEGWKFAERRVIVDFQRAGETFLLKD